MLALVIDVYKEKCDNEEDVKEFLNNLIDKLEQTDGEDANYDYYTARKFLYGALIEVQKHGFNTEHGQNGTVPGGNKVTKEELLEQLEELRNQIDILNAKIKELDENTEPNTRTKPMEGRPFNYIYANREIEIHQEDFFDKVFDVSPTKTRVSIGNYFKSQDDARKVIRAMEIEQAVRVRRIELNNGWEPDWDDGDEDKFYIYSEPRHNPNSLRTGSVYVSDYNPIFGYYKSLDIADQIQEEFREELLWYFNEYYPNRDKMYIWNK